MAGRRRPSAVEEQEFAALDEAERRAPEQDASMAIFGQDDDSYDAQGTTGSSEDATVRDAAVADAIRPDFDETSDGLSDIEEATRSSAEDIGPDEPLEERVRRKAYELWESEGGPHGRAQDHWHLAAQLVAEEDAQRSSLLPFEGDLDQPVEEAQMLDNVGEFPGLTDQGEDSEHPRKDRDLG
jgi:hypothetical protein